MITVILTIVGFLIGGMAGYSLFRYVLVGKYKKW